MEELLEYVKLRYEGNRQELDKATELLEYLYFMYIDHPFRFLRRSEEYRIAKDLLKLKHSISTENFKEENVKTRFVKGLLTQYSIDAPVTKTQIKTIENNIIEPNRYYITAAFIAEIVRKNQMTEYMKRVASGALALLATLASFDWLFS